MPAWATVRDRWRGSGGVGRALSGVGLVLGNRQTWLVALVGLGTSAPLLASASRWGVPFLETAYRLSRTQAAVPTSLIFVGWGRRSTHRRLAVGSHRPPQAAAHRGIAARDGGARSSRLCSGPAGAGAGGPVLPGRLLRLGADRLFCARQGEPSRRAERDRHRFRQRHGDRRGRPVSAACGAAARPRVDRRDLVGCPCLCSGELPPGVRIADCLLPRRPPCLLVVRETHCRPQA